MSMFVYQQVFGNHFFGQRIPNQDGCNQPEAWNSELRIGSACSCGTMWRDLALEGYDQWPLLQPKLEVPTVKKNTYKTYVGEYPQKIWAYVVLTYLHFGILKIPLT